MTQLAQQLQPPPELIQNLQKALAHQKNGKMDEADKIYKKAVKDFPQFPDVTVMAAIFYIQIERYRFAVNILKKIISKNKNDIKTHKLLGEAYLGDERYEEATRTLAMAVKLAPRDPEAHLLFATAYHRTARFGQARTHYQEALKGKDRLEKHQSVELHNRLAEVYLAQNEHDKAIALLQPYVDAGHAYYDTLIRLALAYRENSAQCMSLALDAILLDKEKDEAKALFSHCCESYGSPNKIDKKLAEAVSACFDSRYVNHQNLVKIWEANFFGGENLKTLLPVLQAETFNAFKDVLADVDVYAHFMDPFFAKGVAHLNAYSLQLERFFTFFRRYYLEKLAAGAALTSEEEAVIYAFSKQCFKNEYIYDVSDEEQAQIDALRTAFEQKTAFTAEDYTALAILGAYEALNTLKNADALTALDESCGAIYETVTMQLLEPREEERIKKTIKSISRIENKVSRDVQAQYEENPYPRWTGINLIHPVKYSSVDKKSLERVELLIAGCGTGKQVLNSFSFYTNANITAVDLSKSSLAYAKRKTAEHGLNKNIDYMHGDILELGKLKKKFDYIECSGVLHHMQNPELGLKVLTRLLKKDGKIRLALYSKIARESIFKARSEIEKKSFKPDLLNIRKARAYFKNNSEMYKFRYAIFNWRDFYSASECRDLLFHVQEICFTIPELQALLDSCSLRLEHFALPSYLLDGYKSAFPEDRSLNNLENWHEFEQQNPTTFVAMYQFLAVKK